ncbi:hypothetical protein AQUCO_02000140v1 [Aquilegia coerulea]|uniref:Uncharacterized protein n=1 Tax=Aquilegia coerulea TaxID=218851 RepID=A0A2G5DG77_AQUCA|nr:hypothetical protein AQUCO_02000140v1 [Aquilegia coerulea]
MLRAAPSIPSRECCIYKVPVILRSINEAAYTPQIISIGPLHQGDKNLQPMEAYKLHFLKTLLVRKPNIQLKDYVETLRGMEKQVRNCYFDQEFVCKFSSNDFVQMMLLDGCFIVELLTRYSPGNIEGLPVPYTISLYSDMKLFENQLPYFLLEHLFNFINGKPYTTAPISFYNCAVLHLCGMDYVKKDATDQLGRSGNQVKHFVDLILNCHLLSASTLTDRVSVENESNREFTFIPSATELHDRSGVKFKKGESPCYLDITFKSGVLEIPTLVIEDTTELNLRNMIAMEQCDARNTAHISCYMFLLDSLISTPKDVALLRHRGIIKNCLGSDEEVADLVNKLGSGVNACPWDSPYYEDLKKIHVFYNRRRNKWKANLKRNYFHTPWMTLSFIAALVLLICTVAQTVCSFLSLKK